MLLSFSASTTRLLGTIALPAAVELAWDASGDPTVTGYNLYYGTASRDYTNVVPAGTATSAVVSNLAIGVTYYFAATTYTIDGLESDYSAEASYAVPVVSNPPTLDVLSDVTIYQDSGTQIVPLTGVSSGNPAETQTISISAFSSNPGLVPNPLVTYSSPDTNGSLSFSPAPGSFGSAIITVMVDNGSALSNTLIRSFTVTVSPVINPPTIDLISDQTINENSGSHILNLTGITSGSTNGTPSISVTAVSSNPGLIPSPVINYSSPATTGTLTFTPVTNTFGTAKITVTVTDTQPTNNSSTMSFNVTVSQAVPIAGLLTNATVLPNTTFRLMINLPVTNNDKITMSLASGAPSGAKLTSRKGFSWLLWTPTLAQASTTNLIGINITDSTNPSLSTNETVQVIVLDYVDLVVGSTSIQAGSSGTVSLALASSDGVTNLSFTMPWPTNSLPNPTLSISAAGVAASSLVNKATGVLVTLQMTPGQVLQGSNVIGSITFQSVASQPSGYISLPVSSLSAIKPTSSPYGYAAPTAGKVAVINSLAMLEAGTTSSSGRTLTVLGKVGNTYQLQYCTNFGPGAVWNSLGTYSQTNTAQSFNVDPTIFPAFYRVQQK